MTSSRLQFCTFTLSGHLVGVDAGVVQEILRFQELTPVPLAHRVVRGLLNLRGQIVTALDLRRRLGLPDRAPGELGANVVVRTAEGAVSLLVDDIGDVIEVDATSFESPPESMRGAAHHVIVGAYKLNDRLLLVLDAERATRLWDDADAL